MALNSNPILVTSNITVNFQNRTYIVVPPANIVITLPLITSDGITLVIVREDSTAFTVGITATAPNVIRFSNNPLDNLSTYNLGYQSNIELTSYEGNWLVSKLSTNVGYQVSSIMSGAIHGYDGIECTMVTKLITRITMPSNTPPSRFSAVVRYTGNGSPGIQGHMVLATDITFTTIIMSIYIFNVPGSGAFTIYSTNTLLNSVVYGNTYYVAWVYDHGGQSFYLYSLLLT